MHILRVFNTNVVLARDDDGREVVLTGRGLGYQAWPGGTVDPGKVVRVFVPEDGRNADNFGQMLAAIAPEHVALVDRLLAPVWAELRREPSSTTVLALADHLSFAIKRVQRGIEGVFPLRAELAHLYPRELHWGERIVAGVNAELDMELPAEEAIPIAMHLVNAAFNSGNLALTYRMTGVFSQVFDMIEGEYGQPLDRESVNVARFITHLRYFFVRVHSGDQVEDDQGRFVDAIRAAHPRAYGCAVKVRGLLEMRLESPITEDETGYLTLHIARLTQPGRTKETS